MTGEFIVATIGEHILIPKADNLVTSVVYGEALILHTASNPVGTRGIIIDAESKIHPDILSMLNMYSHSENNKDKTIKGYIKDDGRVRQIRLRGIKCTALFISFKQLEVIVGAVELEDGIQSQELNGVPICEKYVRKYKQDKQGAHLGGGVKRKKDLVPLFKEHFSTDHFMRMQHLYSDCQVVYLTVKGHGTSVRAGLLPIVQNRPWWKRLFNIPLRAKYEFIVGSRKVVKTIGEEDVMKKVDWNSMKANTRNKMLDNFLGYCLKDENVEKYMVVFPEDSVDINDMSVEHIDSHFEGFAQWIKEKIQSSFYNENIWNLATEQLRGKLNKGETVYAEIVGFTPEGVAIQPTHKTEKLKAFLDESWYKEYFRNYGDEIHMTYGCGPREHKLLVYRMSLVSEQGVDVDYSWERMTRRCMELGVETVPLLDVGVLKKIDGFDNIEFIGRNHTGNFESLVDMLANKTMCSAFPNTLREGIVVRVDSGGNTPSFSKHKSLAHKYLEGILRDKPDYVDMEEQESV